MAGKLRIPAAMIRLPISIAILACMTAGSLLGWNPERAAERQLSLYRGERSDISGKRTSRLKHGDAQ